MIFGMIIGIPFATYSFDHENVTALLANWLGPKLKVDADFIGRMLFWLAALFLAVAALLCTWASSYLKAAVVYASQIKTESLVADGPYRRVRNPLYFANVLMAIALGSMMSRSGLVLAVAAMVLFCYRLILREEDELQASQAGQYDAYRKAVPRLWPALNARIASSGSEANWAAGLKAECWYWGFAVGLAAFAITLKLPLFFAAMLFGIALFWVTSTVLSKG